MSLNNVHECHLWPLPSEKKIMPLSKIIKSFDLESKQRDLNFWQIFVAMSKDKDKPGTKGF